MSAKPQGYAHLTAKIAELTEELNDKRRFCYAVECALGGLKGDYIEIIKELRKKLDEAAKAAYERGFDDGFILRKEKDGNGQSEYICTCGIRVTPHRCKIGEEF